MYPNKTYSNSILSTKKTEKHTLFLTFSEFMVYNTVKSFFFIYLFYQIKIIYYHYVQIKTNSNILN